MGGLTPTLGLGMGNAMSMPHTKYVTGFSMPMSSVHSGMTPQTPVCISIYKLSYNFSVNKSYLLGFQH